MAKTKLAIRNKAVGIMMMGVAFVMPMTALPQVFQLYGTKVTSGISLATWIMYTLCGIIPLLYGLVNRIVPLVITNVLWLVVDVAMVYGLIVFGTAVSKTDYGTLLIINNVGKSMSVIGMLCLSSALAIFAHDYLHHGKRA